MTSLSALTKLEMTLTINEQCSPQGYQGFEALLHSIPQLTDLKMNAVKGGDEGGKEHCKFSSILSKLVLPKLRSADFSIRYLSREQISYFAKTHISTLRKLHLHRKAFYIQTLAFIETDVKQIAAAADVVFDFEMVGELSGRCKAGPVD